MNLALFFVLFAFGFVTARIAGINFWMQLGYLSISAFVGPNPQEPVPSQAIINTFFTLALGIWVATAVSRIVWPVLPHVLRDLPRAVWSAPGVAQPRAPSTRRFKRN